MHAITVTIPFCAGHRVLGHQGKCQYLHGHNYRAVVTFESDGLDHMGFVADFGVVKDRLKTWIDSAWDHNFIAHPHDPLVQLWGQVDVVGGLFGNPGHARKPYVMRCHGNPTAENMAKELATFAAEVAKENECDLAEVVIYETDTSMGRYVP
jgi:6-pyruvoyltetrahydropterin/6-carboxytetrahydropterin synthase